MTSIENKSSLIDGMKGFFKGTKEQLENKIENLLKGKREIKGEKVAEKKIQEFNVKLEEQETATKQAAELKQQRRLSEEFHMKGNTGAFGFAAEELAPAAMGACPMKTMLVLGVSIGIPVLQGAVAWQGDRMVFSEAGLKMVNSLACIDKAREFCGDDPEKLKELDDLEEEALVASGLKTDENIIKAFDIECKKLGIDPATPLTQEELNAESNKEPLTKANAKTNLGRAKVSAAAKRLYQVKDNPAKLREWKNKNRPIINRTLSQKAQEDASLQLTPEQQMEQKAELASMNSLDACLNGANNKFGEAAELETKRASLDALVAAEYLAKSLAVNEPTEVRELETMQTALLDELLGEHSPNSLKSSLVETLGNAGKHDIKAEMSLSNSLADSLLSGSLTAEERSQGLSESLAASLSSENQGFSLKGELGGMKKARAAKGPIKPNATQIQDLSGTNLKPR